MLFTSKIFPFKTEKNAVREQTNIITDTIEKQRDSHTSINIDKNCDKVKKMKIWLYEEMMPIF